jgi:DNA-binding CsgD family transcriptional regulator
VAPTFQSRQQKSKTLGQPAAPEIGGQFIPDEGWVYIRTDLRLSDRELRIVQGVWVDQTPESIALAMEVTYFVVYRTLQRIYIKLHIGSRLELKSRVWASYAGYLAKPVTSVTYQAGAA